MKVNITFEDAPSEEDENNVSIDFDFVPKLTPDTEITPAGFLATEVMSVIQKLLQEKEEKEDAVNNQPSIILASP